MIAGEAIITLDDKFDTIQRLDPRWHSLNDRICCTRCGRIFPAREVAVLGGSRAFGPLRLHCPNEHCLATPEEWRKCNLGEEHLSPAEISVTRNGQVCFVRRMKRIQSGGEAAAAWLEKPTGWVLATLRRLDANWTAFWARLGKPLSQMDAQSTDSLTG